MEAKPEKDANRVDCDIVNLQLGRKRHLIGLFA